MRGKESSNEDDERRFADWENIARGDEVKAIFGTAIRKHINNLASNIPLGEEKKVAVEVGQFVRLQTAVESNFKKQETRSVGLNTKKIRAGGKTETVGDSIIDFADPTEIWQEDRSKLNLRKPNGDPRVAHEYELKTQLVLPGSDTFRADLKSGHTPGLTSTALRGGVEAKLSRQKVFYDARIEKVRSTPEIDMNLQLSDEGTVTAEPGTYIGGARFSGETQDITYLHTKEANSLRTKLKKLLSDK